MHERLLAKLKASPKLFADETTAPVVARIFAEFLTGFGLYAIAERLTHDGILCPSAHDRARFRRKHLLFHHTSRVILHF